MPSPRPGFVELARPRHRPWRDARANRSCEGDLHQSLEQPMARSYVRPGTRPRPAVPDRGGWRRIQTKCRLRGRNCFGRTPSISEHRGQRGTRFGVARAKLDRSCAPTGSPPRARRPPSAFRREPRAPLGSPGIQFECAARRLVNFLACHGAGEQGISNCPPQERRGPCITGIRVRELRHRARLPRRTGHGADDTDFSSATCISCSARK